MKRLLVLLALLFSCVSASAQITQSQVIDSINKNIPTNGQDLISAASIRGVLTTMTSATFQNQPTLTTLGTVTAQSALSSLPSGGVTGAGYQLFNTGNFGLYGGTGTPTLSAATGSIYIEHATGIPYYNSSGSAGGTTWTQLSSSSAGGSAELPVVVATTGSNITLSGEQTIDGVLTSASRVLVKDQSTASQNGCYVTGAGAWLRCADWNTTGQVAQGTQVYVAQGTVNKDLTFVVTTANPITVGSTPIAFAQQWSIGSPTMGGTWNFTGHILSNNGLGVGGVMDMVDNGAFASTVTPFSFATTSESYSFPDVNTHYTVQILSLKAGNGTGSRTVLVANQTCEGMDSGGYCVGIQGTGIALASSGGNYVGMNAVSEIPVGLTGVNSAYGIEADNIVGSPVGVKNGVRIADEGTSLGTGTTYSAAIEIIKLSTAAGYNDGLLFAQESGGNPSFPVIAGGTLIRAEANTVVLNAGIDLSAITGGFTEAALVLPPAGGAGSNAIWFGSSAQGGSIVSGTGVNGGSLQFGNGVTYFGFGVALPWSLTNTAAMTVGVQQTTAGSVIIANAAGGAYAATITSSASASAATSVVLPPAAPGGNGYALVATTAGVTSWANIGSGPFLPLAGGTMSGTFAIAKSIPTINLNGLEGSGLNAVIYENAGQLKFDQTGVQGLATVTLSNGNWAFNGSVTAPSYVVGSTAGASCTLTVVSHLTVVNGIVTLCN